MSELVLNILPLTEQTEIVRILGAFFEQEAQAKAQAEAALEAIDTMKNPFWPRRSGVSWGRTTQGRKERRSC